MLWLELPHERGLEYYEAIVPTFVASFAGYLTEAVLGGTGLFPTWQTGTFAPPSLPNLGWAILLGLLCIPFGLVYSTTFGLVGRGFRALSVAVYVRTTVAGAVIGLFGWLVPLSYFYGGAKMNTLLSGGAGLRAVVPGSNLLVGLGVTLAVVMVAGAATIRGSWIGGLIIPHMFMGALVGRMAALVVPGLAPVVAMLTGMAAFNSVVTGTPLSSALIAIAFTDGASITPVFLASLVAFWASPTVRFIDEVAPRSEGPGFYSPEE